MVTLAFTSLAPTLLSLVGIGKPDVTTGSSVPE